MKRIILILVGVVSAVRLASASNTFSYTATGSPGSTPDGVDQNNNPVNVWTEIYTPGGTNGANDNGEDGEGVYFGNPDGSGGIGGSSENSWQEYSYPNDFPDLGGSVDSTNIFVGGPLAVGQTVSINFVMRATDAAANGRPAGLVGVSLLTSAIAPPPPFRLSASVNAGTNLINFQTQNGYTYTVLYSGSLSPANWQTLTTIGGDGLVKTITDTTSTTSQSQRFYRVEAQAEYQAGITFYVYGGGPGYYLYTDAGSTGADAGPLGYQYQNAFNIAFTVTGANTYSAIAGSDSWSGTFNGSLIGIDVFNHRGGNGSDVGFNNLTIAPALTINNISPNDNIALFNVTNKLSFTIASASSPVNASGVQVILNGANISSHLVFVGAGTENVSVAYTNLLLNQNYVGQINVTNEAGAVVTAPVLFDTFSSNYFTWEAEDFDFTNGEFINDPVISTNPGPATYYNTVGVSNSDEYVPNYDPTQPHLWRTNDQVSIDLAGDTPRPQFIAAGVPGGYNVGYFNTGNWVNYTRIFTPGIYNIYARLANGNGGLYSCSLAEVTNGVHTTSQTTAPLGVFQSTSLGWNDFTFVPLTDQWGNLLAVTLNGQTPLRVTSGPLGGAVNVCFFMLAPGSNTPPAIANIYPDGLQPFEATNTLTFTVSSSVSTISQNNIQVILNGTNASSQLVFSGVNTNWTVTLPLGGQGLYTAVITATDAAGNSNSHNETFDTFTQNNIMIEADEYDFNGGAFIDSSIETATNYTAVNSYYPWPTNGNPANVAVYGIDVTTSNANTAVPGEEFYYRYDAMAGTAPDSDFLRNKFINTGQDDDAGEPLGYTNEDFDLEWWNTGTWLNYTRTFPANNYYIYGRLAAGVAYTNTTLSLVTLGQGTMNQTTQLLGSFSDPDANGFQSWHWIPLMNNGTNVVVSLGGVETLKATAGSGGLVAGNVNAHFYMFVPAP